MIFQKKNFATLAMLVFSFTVVLSPFLVSAQECLPVEDNSRFTLGGTDNGTPCSPPGYGTVPLSQNSTNNSSSNSNSSSANCDPAGGKICNPIGQSSITDFIEHVLEGALKLGFPVIALAIIYCGFLFVMARGKEEKITEAKSALMYTLIGAAVLLGAWTLAQIISETVISLSK